MLSQLLFDIVAKCNSDQMSLKDAVGSLVEENLVDIDTVNDLWYLIFENVYDDGDEDTYCYKIKKDEE